MATSTSHIVAASEQISVPLTKVTSVDSGHNSESLKGAWSVPLLHQRTGSGVSPPIQPPSLQQWPSLSNVKHKPKVVGNTSGLGSYVPSRVDRKEDDVRFPWAARMNSTSRNLYRATEPEYLEDGTPKVTIPRHVLLQGLDNQKEYILGQFYRCSPPPGGLIFAVFNKLWGRKCRITIRKLGESNYLFHIPDEATRNWVLQRALWHVDDCLMFVASWSPAASLSLPEIKTIPAWVTLKNIPNILYSIPGISHIASGLGAPMATHKPRLDPVLMGEAKILVEVELSKAFPPKIAAGDENGFISMVDVEYSWLPTKCSRCGQLGHKVKRCLQSITTNDMVDGNLIVVPAPVCDTSIAVVNETVSVANEVTKGVVNAMVTTTTFNIVSQPNVTTNSASSVEVSPIIVDSIPTDLISLASISILETMFDYAPTMVMINETVESPILESVEILPVAVTTSARAETTFQGESSKIVEPDFGSNKFASLSSLEEEEVDPSDSEMDSVELLTPLGKRILRDRPVRPSTKAKEMLCHTASRGRGNRGRGNKGGRG